MVEPRDPDGKKMTGEQAGCIAALLAAVPAFGYLFFRQLSWGYLAMSGWEILVPILVVLVTWLVFRTLFNWIARRSDRD